MESRAKLLGHPIHQMLVVFPLGLLATAVVFDLVHLVGNSPTMATVSYWMIFAGVISGLIAAPFGTVDWLAIPKNTRAKRVGLVHGVGNAVVVLLFGASWMMRIDTPTQPGLLAIALGLAGAGLSLVTAWLGGELVSRLAVGVSDGAGLDASSSLKQSR